MLKDSHSLILHHPHASMEIEQEVQYIPCQKGDVHGGPIIWSLALHKKRGYISGEQIIAEYGNSSKR